jgi:hypothetical protein
MTSKYGKYITTELKRNVVMPGYKGPQLIRQGYADGHRLGLEHVILDGLTKVLPGGFYGVYHMAMAFHDEGPDADPAHARAGNSDTELVRVGSPGNCTSSPTRSLNFQTTSGPMWRPTIWRRNRVLAGR